MVMLMHASSLIAKGETNKNDRKQDRGIEVGGLLCVPEWVVER